MGSIAPWWLLRNERGRDSAPQRFEGPDPGGPAVLQDAQVPARLCPGEGAGRIVNVEGRERELLETQPEKTIQTKEH